jgi:ferredoxin-type protein NapF
MDSPIDPGRRAFLGMRRQRASAAVRPPWTSAELIAERCTHCGDCIAACPERILIADHDGAPIVDFGRGGCTFCGACAESCTASVFQRDLLPPWRVTIAISDRCLPRRGILCESCRDACGEEAIHFARAPGRVPVPEISSARCTGCGACLSVCPESAISAVNLDGGAADG